MCNKTCFAVVFIFFVSFHSAYSQHFTPGDGVRVTFYNISDQISGDYFVQTDGNIQLPYVGLIGTNDRDFESVRAEIISKYESLYKNPEITVQPLYKIRILGEISKPGIYYVTGVEKLSDVLALAGGETENANLNKIYFIQNDTKININAKEMFEKGKKISDIGLKSGDQIYVPRKWLSLRKASVILTAVAVTATVVSLVVRK
jgi:polysaccharide export outer membrane protein